MGNNPEIADVDAPVHIWSGLLSGGNPEWQRGLKRVARGIGGAAFHPSDEDRTGYRWWRDVADAAIARRAKSLVLIGHSNGGFAITSVAAYLAQKAPEIACYLCCFDRTMKACPRLGANVPEALDIWAGLKTLEKGPGFAGTLISVDLNQESHIGVINNRVAQNLAIAFGRKWKA